MPIRTTRIMRDARLEYSGTGENAHFDDDAAMMKGRPRKVTSDVGWSENPASRTRHPVRHVMYADGPVEGEYELSNAFIVDPNRRERNLDLFASELPYTLRLAKNHTGYSTVNRR